MAERVRAMEPWLCICGRTHAAWWRTTPPPSCPNGWPDLPPAVQAPPSLDHIIQIFGGPFPLPSETEERRDA